MLKNCDKLMHLCFNFDACPMHSPFGLVHMTHQNFSARAFFFFGHNLLAKVSTQLLICEFSSVCNKRRYRVSPTMHNAFIYCSGSTSHNAQCFYDDQDQFSQFSPHCRMHVHSSIMKDTVWIAEFSWFSSLFGIFKALLPLDNLNR